MKRLLTLLVLFPLISTADFVPTFSNAWNIAQSTREAHRIEWYQASTVRRVYEFHFNNAPVSFPSNTVVTWDVVYATNQLLSLVATTGTISNADLGQVRFDLAPEESNLTEGNYIGYVKAWDVSVSPAKLITPLVRQAITVLFSTDSRYYDFVGPKTYTLGTADLGPGIVTPEILDRAYAETGTVAAIDLRLAALELEPMWSSSSGSVWSAIQGKSPSSHQHTLSDITDAGSMAAEDVGDYYTATASDSLFARKTIYGADAFGARIGTNLWVGGTGTFTAVIGSGSGITDLDYTNISNPPTLGTMATRSTNEYQPIGAQTITYIGTNITWDVSMYSSAAVMLTNNARLAAATGIKPGGRYTLRVTQDPTGGRLLTYADAYLATGGIAPTLTSVTNRTDLLIFDGISTTNIMRSGFFPDVR